MYEMPTIPQQNSGELGNVANYPGNGSGGCKRGVEVSLLQVESKISVNACVRTENCLLLPNY